MEAHRRPRMQLFDSASSPFVRKVNVVVHALGLDALVKRRSQSASVAAAWFARFETHRAMLATLPRPCTIASAGPSCPPQR